MNTALDTQYHVRRFFKESLPNTHGKFTAVPQIAGKGVDHDLNKELELVR